MYPLIKFNINKLKYETLQKEAMVYKNYIIKKLITFFLLYFKYKIKVNENYLKNIHILNYLIVHF